MKKTVKAFLCGLLAVCSVLCFVACEDGKCDNCKTKEDVKVYETKDGEEMELCPECYAKKAADDILGGLLGE